ncbi:MAG: NUDIX hydrolase [Clostridiales bacterium]|nr:NUDIX hydrolase [Clostridiales bacterium]
MSELIGEEIKYQGPRFDVVRKIFKNEKIEYIRDIAQTKDAVVVIPITENNEIIFVKQTREVVGEETLELPAGIIEEGEDNKVAGLRELKEETGYIANSIEFLTEAYASCGFTNEKLYYYVAKDLVLDKQQLDEDETITEVIKIPAEKCIEMVKNNEFKTASANIALLHYYLKYMK